MHVFYTPQWKHHPEILLSLFGSVFYVSSSASLSFIPTFSMLVALDLFVHHHTSAHRECEWVIFFMCVLVAAQCIISPYDLIFQRWSNKLRQKKRKFWGLYRSALKMSWYMRLLSIFFFFLPLFHYSHSSHDPEQETGFSNINSFSAIFIFFSSTLHIFKRFSLASLCHTCSTTCSL